MKILLVSNMYPNRSHPYYGTFVKKFCDQLDQLNIGYTKSVMMGSNTRIEKVIRYTYFYLESFVKALLGKYDLVYIHYPSYSALGVLAARKFKKFKIYVNLHGSDTLPVNAAHEKMLKYTERTVSLAEKIVVPSEYFKKIAGEKFCYPLDDIYVYPSGGIDMNVFKEYDAETVAHLKSEYGIEREKMVVSFISRMVFAKGWDTFLKAAKIVKDDGYYVQFLMVGNGCDDDLVRVMSNELQVTDCILRLPQQPQEKLVDLYNMSDVFTFPTAAVESLGLVALEAMACGCPVIASDYAAPGEYVVNGLNGFKFQKGNAEELAECIEKYLDSSDEVKLALQVGAIFTAEKYGMDNILKLLLRIFI